MIMIKLLTLLIISILSLIALECEIGLSEEMKNIVQSNEILEKVKVGGPVEYDNIILEGDLDLEKANLYEGQMRLNESEEGISYPIETAKIIETPIIIRNSEIRGSVNSNNIIYKDFWLKLLSVCKGLDLPSLKPLPSINIGVELDEIDAE